MTPLVVFFAQYRDNDFQRAKPRAAAAQTAFGILADAERVDPLKVCEDLSMAQRSVAVDLEREKPISERLRNQ